MYIIVYSHRLTIVRNTDIARYYFVGRKIPFRKAVINKISFGEKKGMLILPGTDENIWSNNRWVEGISRCKFITTSAVFHEERIVPV